MAGVATDSPVDWLFACFSFYRRSIKQHANNQHNRKVCVTVGLSSEVYLLPTSNKICDF